MPAAVPKKDEIACEDDGSLQWNLRMAKKAEVGGLVSMQTETFVKGPQPKDRQLVLVVSTRPFDMEIVAELGVARAVQWWYPGNLLQCTVINRTNTPLAVPKFFVVAKVHAQPTQATRRGCGYCWSGPE